jgi:hypothetical protein
MTMRAILRNRFWYLIPKPLVHPFPQTSNPSILARNTRADQYPYSYISYSCHAYTSFTHTHTFPRHNSTPEHKQICTYLAPPHTVFLFPPRKNLFYTNVATTTSNPNTSVRQCDFCFDDCHAPIRGNANKRGITPKNAKVLTQEAIESTRKIIAFLHNPKDINFETKPTASTSK